jgi:hypothetical protein
VIKPESRSGLCDNTAGFEVTREQKEETAAQCRGATDEIFGRENDE